MAAKSRAEGRGLAPGSLVNFVAPGMRDVGGGHEAQFAVQRFLSGAGEGSSIVGKGETLSPAWASRRVDQGGASSRSTLECTGRAAKRAFVSFASLRAARCAGRTAQASATSVSSRCVARTFDSAPSID